MITLDRHDPAEHLLCRFMGLRADSPDTLCVAFGRGKLMSPPLVGDEINSENIHGLVTRIRQACSCSMPLPTIGVDIPLVWSDAVDSTVILMDQELDLSQLDVEVQNMLAAKATAPLDADPTVVPIPSGGQTATPAPLAAAMSNHFRTIAISLAFAGGMVMALVLSRRWSRGVKSTS